MRKNLALIMVMCGLGGVQGAKSRSCEDWLNQSIETMAFGITTCIQVIQPYWDSINDWMHDNPVKYCHFLSYKDQAQHKILEELYNYTNCTDTFETNMKLFLNKQLAIVFDNSYLSILVHQWQQEKGTNDLIFFKGYKYKFSKIFADIPHDSNLFVAETRQVLDEILANDSLTGPTAILFNGNLYQKTSSSQIQNDLPGIPTTPDTTPYQDLGGLSVISEQAQPDASGIWPGSTATVGPAANDTQAFKTQLTLSSPENPSTAPGSCNYDDDYISDKTLAPVLRCSELSILEGYINHNGQIQYVNSQWSPGLPIGALFKYEGKIFEVTGPSQSREIINPMSIQDAQPSLAIAPTDQISHISQAQALQPSLAIAPTDQALQIISRPLQLSEIRYTSQAQPASMNPSPSVVAERRTLWEQKTDGSWEAVEQITQTPDWARGFQSKPDGIIAFDMGRNQITVTHHGNDGTSTKKTIRQE